MNVAQDVPVTSLGDRGDDRAVNASTALARVIVDELVRNGVTDVVLAPGSRSAPLAIELAKSEARHDIRLHVRVDERSAGFLALGLAKATDRPTPVVTTSGTAIANLLPAVTEASYAGVPLVVISADRPHELRATGSSQTIDQAAIFGSFTRMTIDMPAPVNRPGQVAYWRSTIARAASVAAAPTRGGPVHVNVAFMNPLVPDSEIPPDQEWCESLQGRGDGEPWTTYFVSELTLQEPIDVVLAQLGINDVPERGFVIVGDVGDLDDADAAIALAEACGWPIHSEPSGNARRGAPALAHAALLLTDATFAAAHVPDVVVTVGRVGLSRPLLDLVRRTPTHIAVDARGVSARPEYADPMRTAIALLPSVPGPATTTDASGDVIDLVALQTPNQWSSSWHNADEKAQQEIDATIAAQEELTSLEVARIVSKAAREGVLFIASSRPVRDVEAVAAVHDDEPYTLGNRGANGIDGLVSTAWGIALGVAPYANGVDVADINADADASDEDGNAETKAPACFALLGDIAFLHDINGLLTPADEPRPDLVYVVADNNGGGIFSSLEQGRPAYAEHFERVFGTPHDRDLVAIASAYGVPAHRVSTGTDLVVAIDEAVSAGGVHVLIADVGSREAEAEFHLELQRRVSAVI